jgi:hypothetical protein
LQRPLVQIQQIESPLWKIRTRQAVNEKVEKIIEEIKVTFLGNRIFLPFNWLKIENKLSVREIFQVKYTQRCSTCNGYECTIMIQG